MRLKAAILLSSAALAAGAAEFVVTNFTGSLNDPATYENAAVPGADDVIVWPEAAVNTLDAPLAVRACARRRTACTRAWTSPARRCPSARTA